MRFKARFHDGIKDGSITLTYRSWKRAQVKVGNAYKIHAIGMIQVDAMDMVKTNAITEADAGEMWLRFGRGTSLLHLFHQAGG